MEPSLNNLYPTLIECFGTILIGYIAGRYNWFTTSEGKGISLFISYIALPALIFKAMVEVDFDKVNWLLWSGLLISKTILFVIAVIFSLVFHKNNRFGKAGLYAIFVTQSNDFAFGLPLLEAIFYKPSNKYLLDYLYLVAPISLAFLNPLGFALLEYQKAKNECSNITDSVKSGHSTKSKKHTVSIKKIFLRTLKGIVTNPFVFMIAFGVIANFALKQELPGILKKFFQSLGGAFGATALFYLGWNLGNSPSRVSGMGLLAPAALVFGKGILLPVVMRQVVSSITASSMPLTNINNSTDNYIDDISTFAFLYGAVPTAPTVMIYAGRYATSENVIGSGLVCGTVLSAPIIFASIKMLEVKNMIEASKFAKIIGNVCTDVSILTVVCAAWVILVFVFVRFYRRRPHIYTLMLLVAQLTLGVLGATYDNYVDTKSDALLYIILWVLLTALFACCCWTSVIAIWIAFCRHFNTERKKTAHILCLIYGIGVPSLLSLIVIFATPDLLGRARSHKYFFLSHCFKDYAGLSVPFMVLNILTILIVCVSMIKLKHSHVFTPSDTDYENLDDSNGVNCDNCVLLENNQCVMKSPQVSYPAKKKSVVDIEDVDKSLCIIQKTHEAINSPLKEKDVSFLKNIDEMEKLNISRYALLDRYHISNHVVLILAMTFSMVMNLTLSIWSLLNLNNHARGIYLEIEMLDIVLIYGQGFLSLVIFGFVKEFFMLPFFERFTNNFSKCFHGQRIKLKDISDLDPEVLKVCERFREHHLSDCMKDVASTYRFNFKIYEKSFKGTVLVTWLVNNGLAKQRSDAVKYANQLLMGRVLRHAAQRYFFYDLPYMYQFIEPGFESSIDSTSSSASSTPGTSRQTET